MSKDKKTMLIVGLVIAGFLFYWFQIRTAQARGTCSAEAYTKSEELTASRQNAYDYYFKKCMNSYGLK